MSTPEKVRRKRERTWNPLREYSHILRQRRYLSLSVESPSATDPKFAVEVASDAPVRIRHTVADASTKVVVGPYVIGALRSRCGRRVIECDGAKVGAKIDDVMYSSYVASSQSQMRLAAHCKPTERER